MTILAIAGLIFLAIHLVPATRLRAQAMAAIGEGPYTGLFVVASLASFFFWAWAFEQAPVGERAWYYPDWWPWLKAMIMLLAFILLVGGLTSPNPTAVRQGEFRERPDVGHGIFAITRHPLMWAFGIWGPPISSASRTGAASGFSASSPSWRSAAPGCSSGARQGNMAWRGGGSRREPRMSRSSPWRRAAQNLALRNRLVAHRRRGAALGGHPALPPPAVRREPAAGDGLAGALTQRPPPGNCW